MSKLEADNAEAINGISMGENRRRYYRTYVDKGNLAPPAERSDWFFLESVCLGNSPSAPQIDGDWVGVSTTWTYPTEGTAEEYEAPQDQVEEVLKIVKEGKNTRIKKGITGRAEPDGWIVLALYRVLYPAGHTNKKFAFKEIQKLLDWMVRTRQIRNTGTIKIDGKPHPAYVMHDGKM
jgi:hypothetical protein